MRSEYGDYLLERVSAFDQEVLQKMSNRNDLWYSEKLLKLYDRFKGCSDEEIEAVKTLQNIDFIPETYRQYLRVMGHENGNVVFRSINCTWTDLKRLKQAVQSFLAVEDKTITLPTDALVFFFSHGTEFYFFPTAEHHDDPPVYYWHESFPSRNFHGFILSANSLSQWFENWFQIIQSLVHSNNP
jgi:hypothetical protein